MILHGWNDDAQEAMKNGSAYFAWWDRAKTGVLVAGIVAVIWAWNKDAQSKRSM